MQKKDLDAIVIGSGPNGLAAAITLARAGHSVVVYEKAANPGGGTRSEELTLPGFLHDVCSAAHPMAIASPFFYTIGLELKKYGLEWIHSQYPLAHPWHDGTAVWLERSVEATAAHLGKDERAYISLMNPLVKDWDALKAEILGPILHIPRHPIKLAKFGLKAILSADRLARSKFQTEKARAIFGGIAAHSSTSLRSPASAAVGLVLQAAAHAGGWPIPRGGSQKLADAMVAYLKALGGELILNTEVESLRELPPSRWIFMDLTPRQVASIAADELPQSYLDKLRKFKYGPGVFKMDWALSGPIPWSSSECAKAATVHLGCSLEELTDSEENVVSGKISEKPYVLLCQSSLFDSTRAPSGKHTAWAYCHVPHAWPEDMTDRIENQIERFAPGFKSRILAKSKLSPADLEKRNPNLVGGDISGGMNHFIQQVFRPVVRIKSYTTPNPRLFICSSSTPPGPGVHGMGGYNAVAEALS